MKSLNFVWDGLLLLLGSIDSTRRIHNNHSLKIGSNPNLCEILSEKTICLSKYVI